MELAVAAGLRALVAEERPDVGELHRLRQFVHPVLEVGAADRRRSLRPQGEAALALVLEGEHLLADDVGRFADAAFEERRVLEGGRLDRLVAGAVEDPGGGALQARPGARLPGRTSKVPRGAWNLLAIGGDLSWAAAGASGPAREEGIGRALGAERGQSHVAGMDDGLVREGLEQRPDRGEQRRPVAAGQVDAADRALEEDVAGEDRVLAADRVGDVAGAVARGEDDVELQPGQLQRLAAAHGLVGLVVLVGAEALPRGRRP